MGMTSHAITEGLVDQLGRLDYRLVNEEPGIWFWEVGDADGGGFASDTVALPFDSQAEAALAALADLIARTRELLQASRMVIGRWERGDLAEAVRELDRSAQAFAESLPE